MKNIEVEVIGKYKNIEFVPKHASDRRAAHTIALAEQFWVKKRKNQHVTFEETMAMMEQNWLERNRIYWFLQSFLIIPLK